MEAEAKDLTDKITFLYESTQGILGYRRMQLWLYRCFGLYCNEKKVYRIMQVLGLRAVIRRKKADYERSSPELSAENILDREFAAVIPNEKWLTDITEMKYGKGQKLYLCAIFDINDRSIVAHTSSKRNDSKLVLDTLALAMEKNPAARPLLHSDRGSQYTSKVYRNELDGYGIQPSMSRPGKCLDNGPMEGFWGNLKAEMYHLKHFSAYADLKAAIDEYIHFYNNCRYQKGLGGLAPLEYRMQLQP